MKPWNLQEARKVIERARPEEIRRSLRSSREVAGLNQLELAKLSGVPQSNIHRIEDGKQAVTPRTLMRLANAIQRAAEKRLAQTKKIQEGSLFKAMGVPRGALHDALGLPGEREKVERAKRELEQWQRYLLALDAALDNPEKHTETRYDENSKMWTATFTVPPYNGAIDQETFDLAAVNKRIDEKLQKSNERIREKETERKRQLAALENLQSIDDPIIAEIIESFRREIVQQDKQIEALSHALERAEKNG